LVDVVCADVFTVNFSRFNIIYVYPFPTVLERLSEKIAKECSKDARMLVHEYMLKGLTPVQSIKIQSNEKEPPRPQHIPLHLL
jgi:hypothetical protein